MSEYNPMEELGLTHDKLLICSTRGFLVQNDVTRDICERFIDKGDRFYDLISRFDDIVSYVLNREQDRPGNTSRIIAPYLRAYGATDYSMYSFCKQDIRLMPEAQRVIRYFQELLPSFIITMSFKHEIMALTEALGIPPEMINCSQLTLDDADFTRQESRSLKECSNKLSALPLSKHSYKVGDPMAADKKDIDLINTVDEMLHNAKMGSGTESILKNMSVIGANEKTYWVLDMRNRTHIDLCGLAYIGGDNTDFQAMDIIRDGHGLSMSFNGSEIATHGANIAVISRDCTAAAVLVQEFYNEGIEAVYDLVANWDRESLRKRDCPDRNLMDYMLKINPKKLPEVYAVDRKNVEEIATKSDAYRKKLLRAYQ